jgi:hypothetical protein
MLLLPPLLSAVGGLAGILPGDGLQMTVAPLAMVRERKARQ